jgi:hypothetical protein
MLTDVVLSPARNIQDLKIAVGKSYVGKWHFLLGYAAGSEDVWGSSGLAPYILNLK